MAIQMRRGLSKDFDPTRMVAGEWAVSTDNETEKQMIWMCFRPGVVKRIGTYEDLKDMIEQISEDIKAGIITDLTDIIQPKFNAVNEELANLYGAVNNRIKKFYAHSYGDSTLIDSDNGSIQSVKVFGNSEQKQFSGKNLLPYSLDILKTENTLGVWNGNVYTLNGVTFTVNDDLSIKIGGSFSQRAYFYVSDGNKKLSAGTYTASGCPIGGSSDTYRLSISMVADDGTRVALHTTGTETTATLNSQSRFDAYIDIRSASGLGKTFYPMIRLASVTDSTYEPYVGGTPAPNPSYPQEIHSVVNPTIEVIGSNKLSDKIFGVQVDMDAKTFTRIADSVGLSAGADFDNTNMLGNRRRCNVADNGKILAFYGDANYKEDGSNGQVMVYQPRFYYKVEPLKVDGQSLKKANYYISDVMHEGFKIHPMFVKNGRRVHYVLMSAYEGSSFDVSANAYNTTDAQTVDFNVDKLASIANAKPISGLTQNLTRANARKLAQNRGDGWSLDTIQSISATQLLFLIEYSSFNTQTALGNGVVNKASGSGNEAENTGATSNLGNASGNASNGSVTYRGEENPYGNIWKWIDGINIYNYGEGSVHIADHDFEDNKKDGVYHDAGITICDSNGYVSAFSYNEDFDWLFIASEVLGNSSLPVGDYFYQNKASNQYTVAFLGGYWTGGSNAGGFYWYVSAASSTHVRNVGGRLLYVPNADDDYDKYTSATLDGITLYGIGDVRDYVDVDAKGWWECIGSVDLGTLNWNQDTSNNRWYATMSSNAKFPSSNSNVANIICNTNKAYAIDDMVRMITEHTGIGLATNRNVYVYHVNERPSGLLYYELATPIFHPLTDEQLEPFKELVSYYPTMNISVTSDDADGAVDFIYPVSISSFVEYVKAEMGYTKEYIYDMEDKADWSFINAAYSEALAELTI